MRKDMRTWTNCDELRWGLAFLGALLAIPVAGMLGLPLLTLLLVLFLANPGGLGTRLGQCHLLKNIPGFRSGHRGHMAIASLLYLLPISLLGMAVVGIDGFLLHEWLRL